MANAADFASFVNKERERKKNQDLAQQLLGSRGRKSGAGSISSSRTESQKPTLLSRMSGVQKPRSSSAKPAANIDGKWQHDLHKLNNPNGPPKRLNRTVSASQIDRNSRTFNKFASVLDQNAQNARSNNEGPGFNIRGVAQGGPVTIVASNFAPGTTAADIEAVVAPHGGDTIRCKVITAKPTVMAEIVFATKEGADNVIAVFNGKKADGQTLYVYHKGNPGTGALHTRPMSLSAQSFDDMDIDTNGGARTGGYRDGLNQSARRSPPRGPRGRRRF